MNELTPAQRRALRARAHALSPVVAVGHNGLSASVLAEIDRCLQAHELIKVRVIGAERDERDALQAQICAGVEAIPVQHIGNILVVYREKADDPATPEPPAPRRKTAARKSPTRKSTAAPRRPRSGS